MSSGLANENSDPGPASKRWRFRFSLLSLMLMLGLVDTLTILDTGELQLCEMNGTKNEIYFNKFNDFYLERIVKTNFV